LDVKIEISKHNEAFSFLLSVHGVVKRTDNTLIPVLKWEFDHCKNTKCNWGKCQTPWV